MMLLPFVIFMSHACGAFAFHQCMDELIPDEIIYILEMESTGYCLQPQAWCQVALLDTTWNVLLQGILQNCLCQREKESSKKNSMMVSSIISSKFMNPFNPSQVTRSLIPSEIYQNSDQNAKSSWCPGITHSSQDRKKQFFCQGYTSYAAL